jgi:hypothetical protein
MSSSSSTTAKRPGTGVVVHSINVPLGGGLPLAGGWDDGLSAAGQDASGQVVECNLDTVSGMHEFESGLWECRDHVRRIGREERHHGKRCHLTRDLARS